MYKNFLSTRVKRIISPTLTKINRMRLMVTYDVHIEFELNRMHHLDTRTLLRI